MMQTRENGSDSETEYGMVAIGGGPVGVIGSSLMSEAKRAARQSRRIGLLVGVVVAALAISILAWQGVGGSEAEARGRWTADAHCGGCHQVAPGAEAARRSGVPSFVLLASARPQPEAVQAWLATPHPNMPPFQLTVEERANLAAYMVSLAPARR